MLWWPMLAAAQVQLSDENAYNPIPSPDGSKIVAVRAGWGGGIVSGLGRSNLISELVVLDLAGHLSSPRPLGVGFVADWGGAGIVSFRDWSYALLSADGAVLQGGHVCAGPTIRHPMPTRCAERVAYVTSAHAFISVSQESGNQALVTSRADFSTHHHGKDLDDLLALSPDERYVAVGPDRPRRLLSVYDVQGRAWVDLGDIVVSPDRGWDWMKPSWSPWFADSSQLAFFTDEGLIVSSPDGRHRRVVLHTREPAGLAVPSPDGRLIAYATFASRPPAANAMGNLPVWNCSGIWVVGTQASSEPVRVAGPSPESTLGLRWLGNERLVFDRVEEGFPPKARVWLADVPR